MGNSAPAKRWAFAVRKKKEKSCYVMLFSLDCWWIATSYVWVRESMYWTCTTWFGRWVNEPRGGGKGDALFFSYPVQANSFLFTFFFERRSQRPVHLWKCEECPMATRSLSGLWGAWKGKRGKDVLSRVQNHNSTGWWFFFSFFSSQLNWGMMKEGLDQRSTLFVHTFGAIHTE